MEQYKYYSTQRPISKGAYPETGDNPLLSFTNYDARIAVENGTIRAWGELVYGKPLTASQATSYELRPSRYNLDVRRTMDAQAQVAGLWERRKGLPDTKRLTWWYSDFGSFVPGDYVTPEQMASRYELAIEELERSSSRKGKNPQR